jgi:DNA repair exonuclease SbcCD ATPase subunit
MSIAILVLVVLLAGCAVGAIYLAFRSNLRSAAAEAVLLREQIRRTEVELAAARGDANAWRGKAETEATARASADALASRVRGLEAENSELRSQLLDVTASRSALQEQADRVPELQEQVAGLNQRIVTLSSTVAGKTRLAEEQRTHAQKVEALTAVRGEIEDHLKAIASDSLRDNQTSFLQLANAVFEKHKEGAAADLDARREAVEALVIPMRDALQACQTNLAELEKARTQAYGALSSELRTVDTQMAVRSETSKLVNALRAAPQDPGPVGRTHAAQCARTGGAKPLLRLLGRTRLLARGRNIAPGRRDPAAGRPQHRRRRESADDGLS